MRLIRFLDEKEAPRFGWVLDDKIGVIVGSPFEPFRRGAADKNLDEVKLLPPVLPSKIICVGRNYPAHAQEHDAEVPDD